MEGREDVLVAEMGANHRGEIGNLAALASPQIGVITNIGPGHLEFFKSLSGVAAAKAELVTALPADGTAVLPGDDEFIEFLKERTKAKVVTFGFGEGCGWRIEDVTSRDGPGYSYRLGGHVMEIRRYGRHHIVNAAAAAAVGFLLDIPAEATAEAVAGARAAPGRGVLYEIDGILFVDESYNSNPASLKAAVDAFMEFPLEGRRWIVLGDMLELGQHSVEMHIDAGRYCGGAGVDGILTLGEETVELSRAASVQRKAPPQISHFIDAEKLASYLNEHIGSGDGVLVKGSRGMAMERIISAIESQRGASKRRVD
jgi:UDP-N-acetylmuramoyl-tripeptide--D-alanyl-D-alanine ligase